MSPLMVAQLLLTLGPPAIGLIRDLIAVWGQPTIPLAELDAMLAKAEKSYDSYIAEARAKLQPPVTTA